MERVDVPAEGEDKPITILSEKFQGKLVVSVSKKHWSGVYEKYRWVVVVRLASGEFFKVSALASNLKKAWEIENGVIFEEASGNLMVVSFDDEAKLNKVLSEGPWTFQNQRILIKRWRSGVNFQDLDFNTAQVWVQMHNIPFEMMDDKETLLGLVKTIGKVCNQMPDEQEIKKKRFARVRVEINLNQPLSSGAYLNLEESNSDPICVEFRYERIPPACEKCGLITHKTVSCGKKVQDLVMKEGSDKGSGNSSGHVLTSKALSESKTIMEGTDSDRSVKGGPEPGNLEGMNISHKYDIVSVDPSSPGLKITREVGSPSALMEEAEQQLSTQDMKYDDACQELHSPSAKSSR